MNRQTYNLLFEKLKELRALSPQLFNELKECKNAGEMQSKLEYALKSLDSSLSVPEKIGRSIRNHRASFKIDLHNTTSYKPKPFDWQRMTNRFFRKG